jgi:hypothetical protein
MDSGGPVLIDTGSGFTVKYKGKNLYSSVQPRERACKRADHLEIPGRTLVFVPSLGLGYGLSPLLKKLSQPAHIIVVETDEILFQFACQQEEADIPVDEHLTILRTRDPYELISVLTGIGIWKFRRVIKCSLSGGIHLDKEVYDRMFALLESEIQQYWKNKITFIHMAPLWIKNIFLNLPSIPRADDIATLQTDMPVLVAGAGPSLEESIEIIKEIRDHIIIIAVDTALPFFYQLTREGEKDLFPDYLFVLESQVVNLNDFISCKNPGIPLICDITSHPSVLRLFSQKKYFFSSRFADIKLYERMNRAGLLPTEFPPLGSVGVAALYAALHMTTGPVLVTGLDFGYSHNMTHCRGTTHYQFFESAATRFSPVENLIYQSIQARPLVHQRGKGEQNVLTDIVLSSYARQIPGVVRNRPGVYDIGRHGLDLGIPVLDKEMTITIVRKDIQFPRLSYERVSPDATPGAGSVKDFLCAEIEYLAACKNLITPLVQDNTDGKRELSRGEKQSIREIDYTYLHFPDNKPIPLCRRDFLFRELISIEHYSDLLKRILQLSLSCNPK